MNCRLVRDLQSFQSANRLLITGTPLQNNLSELWSLLHFLMPEIFDDYSMFESWFNFSEIKDRSSFQKLFSAEREAQIVTKLHGVLKPFLLRRIKADVEKSLPKKREYVLFAPLTLQQRTLYQALLDGNAREFLEEKQYDLLIANEPPKAHKAGTKRKSAAGSYANTPNKSARTSGHSTPNLTTRSGRHVKKKMQTLEDVSDRQFFAQLNAKTSSHEDDEVVEVNFEKATREYSRRQVALKKLGNTMMQLRLCCNSPYNFYDPYLRADGTDVDLDETLVTSSGKMLLLDALLPELYKQGHKVLLFSQFKGQLDIIQAYANSLRGWRVCRIDGGVSQVDRAAQIKAFNAAPSASPSRKGKKALDDDEPANLFLLSTRAGGQGINLASADTVILFDSDWNPQMDLQGWWWTYFVDS
jgi:ATP-dependent DNA helicase